ncbi:carboxymuconolactone decarboxylase family protein [Chromobacterium piscinae]|uniref:Carboxymuconolactone decarboxylase family protein n=1 Tax=Chromobacterium piscinae TaxID=686831 RepID=A0ABV0H1F4_9NEIS|nr:carboxymuconolactone decarboxylase family protein [Chromobacterium piscinae]MBX9298299.1 carboxymuconolactone decarboxylase family protein [Chromobacterium vaccinii]MBX9345922.1 carboxymuconolactone decarboxylase family protein [Chromobacterium vaccinii]MBX9359580.1 carboxymuconolactone decarboxylase family protein [Chromobacterium vaccinii]MCD4502825.1 carboxymuconolactone decarboxylase family protein [Chromobacterium piscinae]MCD5328342.1 carboxymuconolactone decarboxylase family protein 
MRIDYAQLSPKAYQGLLACKNALAESSLGLPLIELAYLRVAQLNGCAFCLKLHSQALRRRGESQEKLDMLAGWDVADSLSPREAAAIAWTEAVTRIGETRAPDSVFQPLREHFSDAEIADLTLAIALMNAFTRVAVAVRQ